MLSYEFLSDFVLDFPFLLANNAQGGTNISLRTNSEKPSQAQTLSLAGPRLQLWYRSCLRKWELQKCHLSSLYLNSIQIFFGLFHSFLYSMVVSVMSRNIYGHLTYINTPPDTIESTVNKLDKYLYPNGIQQ